MLNKSNFFRKKSDLSNLKSAVSSIATQSKDSLIALHGACNVVQENLTEAMDFVQLMINCSSRALLSMDLILKNISDDEINKNLFTKLSITDVTALAVEKFLFEDEQEKNLVHINYDNDFSFTGDEDLMIYVILNLLNNSLRFKKKISIRLCSQKRCLYFKDQNADMSGDGLMKLALLFCKKVMKSFDGNISIKSQTGKGTEFELQFPNFC